ncbi:MAG: phosphoribosyl-AMP cyclohydrolase [Candidatus Hydrothermarchaeaceae archaeon]
MKINEVNFRIKMSGEDLAVAVVQDYRSDKILMVAFMNKEALQKTVETGKMHYFSTSRAKIWLKGESSKHYQLVREVFIDCDGDALLFKVEQLGGACHKGYYTCFFRKFSDGKWEVFEKKVFEPSDIYGK